MFFCLGHRIEGLVRYGGRTYRQFFHANGCGLAMKGHVDEVEIAIWNEHETIVRVTVPKSLMLEALRDWAGWEARLATRDLARKQSRFADWKEGRWWPRTMRKLQV